MYPEAAQQANYATPSSALAGNATSPKQPTAIQCVASELDKNNQALVQIINRLFQFKERLLGSTPQAEEASNKAQSRQGGFGQVADQLETLGASLQRLNQIANEIERIG